MVVWYFGGTLLSKGGLIRAFGKATGLALDDFYKDLTTKDKRGYTYIGTVTVNP